MIHIPDSIFPTDEKGHRICPKCRRTLADCTCPSFDPTKPKTDLFTPTVRMDKSFRHGKVVTLITGLPPDEAFLKELAHDLKVKMGSGGTFYLHEGEGVIEVQGDRVERVVQELEKMRFAGKFGQPSNAKKKGPAHVL